MYATDMNVASFMLIETNLFPPPESEPTTVMIICTLSSGLFIIQAQFASSNSNTQTVI